MRIKNFFQLGSKSKESANVLKLFVIIYIFQIFLATAVIYITYLIRLDSYLTGITNRVQDDIKYSNGIWDMSKYYTDSLVPGRARLYIFSTDGFILDRWKPIPGLLDFSNFEQLLTFENPTTIKTKTNQLWRIQSKKILAHSGSAVGVVTVSSFMPNSSITPNLDARLDTTVNKILQDLNVNNSEINVQNIDSRNLDFDIAFQVTDKFNKVLIKNNNINAMDSIPSYIDASYIKSEMQSKIARQVKAGNDIFLVKSQTLYDNAKTPIGVVIAAHTISVLYEVLLIYLAASTIIGLILLVAVSNYLNRVLKNADIRHTLLTINEVTYISFSKKDSTITINKETIPLTYATNQYYLCAALFFAPNKKWETDELLERFGEEQGKFGWRKVYDAMAALNSKTNQVLENKLVITNNKTFQINPKLLGKIS